MTNSNGNRFSISLSWRDALLLLVLLGSGGNIAADFLWPPKAAEINVDQTSRAEIRRIAMEQVHLVVNGQLASIQAKLETLEEKVDDIRKHQHEGEAR